MIITKIKFGSIFFFRFCFKIPLKLAVYNSNTIPIQIHMRCLQQSELTSLTVISRKFLSKYVYILFNSLCLFCQYQRTPSVLCKHVRMKLAVPEKPKSRHFMSKLRFIIWLYHLSSLKYQNSL